MFSVAPRLRTRAVVASALLVVVIAALFGVLLSVYGGRHDALNAVVHGEQRLRRSAALQKTLVDIETGVRGFQLTHDDTFLAPYRTGLARLPAQLALVRSSPAGHGALVGRIAQRLRRLQTYAAAVIAADTAGRPSPAVEARRTLVGKQQVDTLRALLNDYDVALEGSLHRSEAHAADAADDTRTASIVVLVGLLLTLIAYGATIVWGVVVPLERARRAELETLNAELQAANHDLEQFAYVASHDLGEPLRTIAGFAELLERRAAQRLNDAEREYLAHIGASATRMRALIDDLLAYARSGGGELHAAEVDTGATVRAVVADLHASDRVAVGELPVLRADPVLLAQLVQNLIANALKFAGDDPVHVAVDAVRDGDAWRFTVRDNGIGVAPEHADLVFGMFRRLNAPERYTGTGMGLAICQRIVERHGGRIWVSPNPIPPGSVFSFTLPADGANHSYSVTAASTT
jgi:signal transduction histidine kinase